jgi:hypothetical protein
VIAYGRFAMTGDPVLANRDPSSASGSEVAMESLQLVAEGLRVDPPAQQAGREGAIMVIGVNHDILSPRDAAPVANAQIVVPHPVPILKDLGGYTSRPARPALQAGARSGGPAGVEQRCGRSRVAPDADAATALVSAGSSS